MAEGVPRTSAAEDSPDISRRGFLGWAVGLSSAFVAIVAGIPIVGTFFGTSSTANQGQEFVTVTSVASLPVNQPTALTFLQQGVDAYIHETLPHSVWVVKKSETDVTVFSPVCPHLGCQVAFSKVQNEFICPCHNSIFALDGKLLGGPSPRGLDTLPSKVENGQLLVSWVNYQPGIPTKVPV